MAAVPFFTLSPPPDVAELTLELLLEEEGFTGVTFDFGVGVIGVGLGLAVLEAVGILAVGQTTAAVVPLADGLTVAVEDEFSELFPFTGAVKTLEL